MSPDGAGLDAVVLLASRWHELEAHRTRWREVVTAWRRDPRIGRIVVVDYPDAFRRRALLDAPAQLVGERPSWLPGVTELAVTLPVRPESAALDAAGYRRLASGLRRTLATPSGVRRLVVSAWPVWNPLLALLRADATGFDAVDDWRSHPEMAVQRHRVHRGYRAASGHRLTAVSSGLAAALAEEYGLSCRVVPNGVDPVSRDGAGTSVPPGLPAGPFAVYVGTVQQRVDLELLRDVVALLGPSLPVLLVGPVVPAVAAAASRTGAVLVGSIAPEVVPSVLQRAAVGIIPHRDDPLTRSMDPMKLYEYVAAGLPVVATPVAVPDDLDWDVVVTSEPAAFAEAVRAAALRPRRPGRALRKPWPAVADELLSVYLGD